MASRKDNKGRVLQKGEFQRPDGRYMYSYSDLNGKRKTIYSLDLNDLRKKEKAILKDLDDGIYTSVGKRTLNEQFAAYMSTKPRISETTRANYIYMWEKDIRDSSIGSMKLMDIRKSHVLTFYAGLSQAGFKNGTIQLYQNLLFPCFQLAVDDNIIRVNPCKDCMKEYSKNDAKKKEALTIEEQVKFIEFTKKNRYYDVHLPMIVFMLTTGCRIGETIGLTWDNVDLKKRMITINHQLTYKKVDGVTKFRAAVPKTEHGLRSIPITDDELYNQLCQQRKNQLMLGIDRTCNIDGYSNFVFTTKGGRPIQPNCVNRFLINIINTYNKEEKASSKKEHREEVLLPGISAHLLRHTACTRMAESGVDVKVLQYIMGHANINMTMDIYNHVDTSRVISEMSKSQLAY